MDLCRAWAVIFVLGGIAVAQAQTQPATRRAPGDDLQTVYATSQPAPALAHHDEISQGLEPILLKQARFLVSQLHPWEKDKAALLLTKGNSTEADIRPNAHAACGFATLYRCNLKTERLSPEIARDKAIAILRFLLPTHGAGGVTTNDNKQWMTQWQSALWANEAGKAAWLLWNDLDPNLRWLAARMICDEADRFVDRPPDHQVERDTKAEENAWNSTVVSLAFNMFPRHPHHAKWGETAIRWQLSAFATARDVSRTDVVDGKPLNQWIQFPNIYDDYTLENHDRVHPDYMTSPRTLATQKLVYDWAGNPAPQALLFNADKIYASLKHLTLPDGGFIYPNGQDWHLHRNADWFGTHATMAVMLNDPQAARLARISLDTAARMIARDPNGGIYAPGETIFASSQSMLFNIYADAYLILRSMGEGPAPISESQLWQQLSGNHLFTSGKFDVLRTDRSIATFSWGRQIMGMALPMTKNLMLTPNDRNLIGMVQVDGPNGLVRDTPTLKGFRRISPIDPPTAVPGVPPLPPNCFAFAGLLSRADGLLEQPFAFLALSDGRTIYLDNPRLTGEKKPRRCDFGTLGILNDASWVHHNGLRMLFFDKGEITFAGREADQNDPADLSSRWYNLDGLGIIVLSSSGQQRYLPHPTKAPGRLEQLFHLSHIARIPESIKPTALVFYPNTNWSRTRDLANVCKLVQPDATHFVITLDDAKVVTIDFARLVITMTP